MKYRIFLHYSKHRSVCTQAHTHPPSPSWTPVLSVMHIEYAQGSCRVLSKAIESFCFDVLYFRKLLEQRVIITVNSNNFPIIWLHVLFHFNDQSSCL